MRDLSDGNTLDPVEDCVVGELRSPLGGHMTGTVNSCECEFAVVAGFNVSTDLSIHEVLLPVCGDAPVCSFNPGLGSISADCHIGIS